MLDLLNIPLSALSLSLSLSSIGLLCELTGKHFIPSKPITTSAMWKMVQDMDVWYLMLAYVENSQAKCTLGNHTMDTILGMGEEEKLVTGKVRMWREAGNILALLAPQRKES